MHILRLETKEELLEILEWIFFRPDGSFSEICEARLSFEEVCGILGFFPEDLLDQSLVVDTDEWYEAIDDQTDEDLKNYILSDKFKLVREFKPGILTWALEDDWDRVGDLSVRVFIFVPDEEATMAAHRKWCQREQADYDHHCELEDRLALLKSQQ